MNLAEMKSCNICKFCIHTDYGYSDYTVDGTDTTCGLNILGANPEANPAFAQECPRYEEGEPIHMNADGDNYGGFTEEQKRIWDRRDLTNP